MQQNCQTPMEMRNDETKMRQNDIMRLAHIKEANIYDIRGIEEQEFSPIDKQKESYLFKIQSKQTGSSQNGSTDDSSPRARTGPMMN